MYRQPNEQSTNNTESSKDLPENWGQYYLTCISMYNNSLVKFVCAYVGMCVFACGVCLIMYNNCCMYIKILYFMLNHIFC